MAPYIFLIVAKVAVVVYLLVLATKATKALIRIADALEQKSKFSGGNSHEH